MMANLTREKPLLVSREEAARILGISLMSVRRLLGRDDLDPVKVGRRTLVTRDSIHRYAKKRKRDE